MIGVTSSLSVFLNGALRLLLPGEVGRLLAFSATVGLAAVAPGWRALSVLALSAALALLLSREAFGYLARDRSWPALGVVAIGLGALVGERDLPVGPIYLSFLGLSLGTQMMVRALAILLAVYTLASSLSLSAITSILERTGFKGLGFALGVAVNALPIAQRNLQDVLTALRLRGGFRRRRLRAVRLLLVTSMVNSIRHAEETVAAAEARGFGSGLARPARLRWQPGDLVLLAFLLGVGLVILAGW